MLWWKYSLFRTHWVTFWIFNWKQPEKNILLNQEAMLAFGPCHESCDLTEQNSVLTRAPEKHCHILIIMTVLPEKHGERVLFLLLFLSFSHSCCPLQVHFRSTDAAHLPHFENDNQFTWATWKDGAHQLWRVLMRWFSCTVRLPCERLPSQEGAPRGWGVKGCFTHQITALCTHPLGQNSRVRPAQFAHYSPFQRISGINVCNF